MMPNTIMNRIVETMANSTAAAPSSRWRPSRRLSRTVHPGSAVIEEAGHRQAERGRGGDGGEGDEDEKQAVLRGHHAALVDEPRLDAVPHGLRLRVDTEEHLSPPFGSPSDGRAVPPGGRTEIRPRSLLCSESDGVA